MIDSGFDPGVRRFACTSCGLCCNRGPEMELSEAAALADKFVLSLLFKVHSIPLKRSKNAGQARAALERFSVRETIDKPNDRYLHLTISALTMDREKGRCPALANKLCTIYDARPLSCRTVPMHYSKATSVLGAHLDEFVGTPGYACDTSVAAPIVFDGQGITDASLQQAREAAFVLAQSEREWKDKLVSLMDDPAAAAAAGLPTYKDVLRHADSRNHVSVPMLMAWRVARDIGFISPHDFLDVCRKQIALITAELERTSGSERTIALARMHFEYEGAVHAADNVTQEVLSNFRRPDS